MKTQLIQRRLDDGTLVVAQFVGDIPRVFVHQAEGGQEEICEVYVESGLLDLGPNIAADANERFNRGLPEFNDEPAMLYFGDAMDCATLGGLNGSVQLDNYSALRSECRGKPGDDPVESRLTSPLKKQAQAVRPPSTWSGLMRRYVAAIYGGNTVDYFLSSNTLTVAGISFSATANNVVGLVYIDGVHRFVEVHTGGNVYTYNLKFTRCGASIFEFWKHAKEKLSEEAALRLLTVALSTATPDPESIETIGTMPSGFNINGTGWQFSPTAPEAHAVFLDLDNNVTILKKMTFTADNEGDWSIAITDVESALLPPKKWGCEIVCPEQNWIVETSDNDLQLLHETTYDLPLYAYYDRSSLVVARYFLETPERSVIWLDQAVCGQYASMFGWGGAAPMNCTLIFQPTSSFNAAAYGYGTEVDGSGGAVPWYGEVPVSIGVYGKKGGATVWSTIKTRTAYFFHYEKMEEPGTYWDFIQQTCMLYSQTITRGDVYESEHKSVDWVTPYPRYEAQDPSPADPRCGYVWEGTFDFPELPEGCTYATYGEYEPVEHEAWDLCATVYVDWFKGSFGAKMRPAVVVSDGDSSGIYAFNNLLTGTFLVEDFYGYVDSREVPNQCVGSASTEFVSQGVPVDVPYYRWDYVTSHYVQEGTVNITYDNPPWFFNGAAGYSYSGPPDTVDPTFPITQWERRTSVGSEFYSETYVGVSAEAPKVASGNRVEHIEGDHFVPSQLLTDNSCPKYYDTLYAETDAADPLEVESPSGTTSVEELLLSEGTLLCNGFYYTARRSLLDTVTYWSDTLHFGASINMDRESITGGYSTVNWPSFVGWA